MQETIVSLIEESLLNYDCVVIPQFGGFVLNTKDFTFDESTSTIYPKRKWVAFNERLRSDDGVLAMALAQKEGLKQKDAFKAIHDFALALNQRIQAGEEVILGKVGTFTLQNESKITFEPNPDTNFDLAQFGLIPVQIKPKAQKPVLISNPVVESMTDAAPVVAEEKQKRVSVKFYTYVILAFMLGGTAAYYLTEPNSRYVNSSMSPLTIKIKKKEKVATPVVAAKSVTTTVPEVAKSVEKVEPIPSDEIYLVAASFLTEEKAALCQSELVSKGFTDVEIIEKEAGEKHFRVSVGRVANFDLGYQKAAELKKDKKLDIWVFKKQ
ncbi:HU family DNA-binding protein [Aquirufa sp. OSTEICH-129V]|uniref:HU family DNA-binding protein n=1 Tax=Aquirufa avitistagni TaxID=3104728 RepID=A0ABW6D9J3_9BACT